MINKNIFTLILISMLLASGCGNTQNEQTFLSNFPGIPMNLALHFWKPSEEFKIGNLISLDLENISPDEIGIPVIDGVEALVIENSKWIKLNNKASYLPPNPEILIFPKGVDNPGVNSVDFVPQIENKNKSINIRVVVVGYIYKDGQKTDQKTGAFIDIELKP